MEKSKKKKIALISSVAVVVIIATVLCVVFFACTTPPDRVPKELKRDWKSSQEFDINDPNMVETIVVDGNRGANIVQLTDIHFDRNNNKKASTLVMIEDVVNQGIDKAEAKGEKLDLIAITGDWACDASANGESVKPVFDLIDSFNIPWAPVFGNHDMEGSGMTRFDYVDFFGAYDNSLFNYGYTNIGGVGNYVVNVRQDSADGKLLQSLVMIDSNTATMPFKAEYQPVTKTQVKWYEWTIKGLNKYYKANGGTQETIPTILFHHIPLKEQRDIFYDGQGIFELGYNSEYIWPANTSNGLFDAIVKLDSTKASIFGHDHKNSSVMAYKPTGKYLSNPDFEFRFVYGVQTGWCKGYAETEKKGATNIVFNTDGTLEFEFLLYDLASAPYDE